MIKSLILNLLLITGLFTPHEIPIAFFDVEMNANKVSVNIKFDIKDLEKTIGTKGNSTIEDKYVQTYIEQNSQFFLNDHALAYEFCSMKKDTEHYIISAELSNVPEHPTSMKFYNTCLLNIDKHANLLQLTYQDKNRTFRLHKERVETLFDL